MTKKSCAFRWRGKNTHDAWKNRKSFSSFVVLLSLVVV